MIQMLKKVLNIKSPSSLGFFSTSPAESLESL